MSLLCGFLCLGSRFHAGQQRGFAIALPVWVFVRAWLIMFLVARCVFANFWPTGFFVIHFNALSALRSYLTGDFTAHARNHHIIQDVAA